MTRDESVAFQYHSALSIPGPDKRHYHTSLVAGSYTRNYSALTDGEAAVA
ncbi:TPA: hypothetical protein M4K80_000825 [Salmonella enterica]|nr:hypothetical protein [Salmonella enterica]